MGDEPEDETLDLSYRDGSEGEAVQRVPGSGASTNQSPEERDSMATRGSVLVGEGEAGERMGLERQWGPALTGSGLEEPGAEWGGHCSWYLVGVKG